MTYPLLPLLLVLAVSPLRPAEEPAPGDTLVLTNATVVPMTGDGTLHDRTLVIARGEVIAIRPASAPVPAGAEVHDLGGRFVVPGLIDGHVHLREPDRSLLLFPVNGVTTVVNLEGRPRHLALRDSIVAAGDALAPRILTSGPYLDEIVGTGEQARREVRRQHAVGYDLVKIHGEMEEGAFEAAIDEAAGLGLPVVGHRPDNLPTDVVLGSGMTALAHLEELLGSSLLSEPIGLTRDSTRAVARALVESGTAVITTLEFFTGIRDQATDRFYGLITQPELAYVSAERRHAWLYDGHREYIDREELPWYDTAVVDLHRIAGAIHEQGGTLVAGTDTPLEYTIPGFSLHDELGHLVAAGLTPLEALRAATVVPADLFGVPHLGRIEVGATADLLVLASDPAESVEALQWLDAVVLRGRWHPRETLHQRREALAAEYARDEVVRAARERVREDVLALVREQGTEAAVEELRRVARLPDAPRLGEADLNSLGYSLLADDDLSTAIEIFRLNVRLHPGSANVYDSLAEAYLSAGRLDEAEQNYRRALELDSTMDSARRGLRMIDERRDRPR